MKHILGFLLLSLQIASAATLYVKPAASGSGNGSDWTNALGATFTPVRGNVYYLADGSYGSRTYTVANSGTNTITFKKATVADHGTATGWSDALGDGSADFGFLFIQTDYWIFDGQFRSNTTEWDGAITTYGIRVNGIRADVGAGTAGMDNSTFRYVDFRGGGRDTGSGDDVFYSLYGNQNLTFQYCSLRDSDRCIFLFRGNQTGHVIEYCWMGRNTSSAANHSELASITDMTNVTWRYNVVEDIEGTAVWAFINGGNATNVQWYGNVVYHTAAYVANTGRPPFGSSAGTHNRGISGVVYCANDASNNNTLSNARVYNNTMHNLIGAPGIHIEAGSGNLVTNNIWVSCENLNSTGATFSYNYFAATGGGTGGGTGTLTGQSTNIFVDASTNNYRLSGTNLPAAGINLGSPWNIDMDGVARGADGAWDRGAFEYVVGGGNPPPIISTATINAAGTQVAIVFSEAVQIGAGGANGFVLNMSGGNITVPSQTPGGTGTTRTYTFSSVRTVGAGETGTIIYTQPGDGIEDTAGADMITGTSSTVINSSTVQTTNAPQFSPITGPYFGTQNVVMTSSTPGATIRYTTDGTDPTASSTQYTAGATGIPISASATLKAKAFAALLLDSSITTATYEIGTWAGTLAWKTFVVPQQAGSFTWTFRASATPAASDVVIGLSSTPVSAFSQLAAGMRFNTSNVIDAVNAAGFGAVNSFTYVPGTTYEFVCTINVVNKTYSATVSQIGGSPTTIANNYAFRQQATELDNVGIIADVGGGSVTQMSFGSVTGTIPALTGATIGASGTNLTLVFDVPVIYGTGGSGGWTISASGGAATLTPSASPTSFTISRTIAIGESVTVSYVQPGNGVEATTGGGDLASRSAFAVNNQSTVDLVAPTPNPSTFSIVPTATGTSTITMTATTSTDANSGPVQYFFNETSGNAGGSDSGWQSSPTFTDTGLAAGTQYTYRVRTRDSASTPNMTSFSNSASATTQSVAGAHPASPFNVARANIVNP